MPAEPPREHRPRPRPPRPVEDPTSQLPATPPAARPTAPPAPGRPRHAAPSGPVGAPRHAAEPPPQAPPAPVPSDAERTAMIGRVARRTEERPAGSRHAAPPRRAPVPPPAAPVDPPTTAMPPAPRRDAAATARVSRDAERTTALGRVERTVVVPRTRREEAPAPAARPGPSRPARRPDPASVPTPVPVRADPTPPPRPLPAPVPDTPPPTPAASPRPVEEPAVSPLRGLAWRAAMVLLSVLVALIGAPAVVAAPVLFATVAVVAERVARHRRRGLLDLVVTAAAGTSAALALLGVALNVSPTGISTTGWALGGGLLALAALGWCARRPVVPGVPQLLGRHPALRRPDPLTAACTAGAVLVLAGTLVVSVLSAQANQQPPLQISAGAPVDGRVLVRIDAGSTSGFFDVVLDVDGVRTVAALAVRLEPGQAQVVPVDVPPVPRALIQLIPPGGTDPLRQLIVSSIPSNTPQEGR